MSRREQENKVLYGFSDLYIGTYTVDEDTQEVTMGTPYLQTGAVGFSPEGQGENYTFYADNKAYFNADSRGNYEGDLVVARFDDAVKKNYLGFVELADGGLAELKNPTRPAIYIMYEVQGDKGPERVIWYNGSIGMPTRELATIEENLEVATESAPVTFVGDNKTGITKVVYGKDKNGFETLFTNPPAPELPSASE